MSEFTRNIILAYYPDNMAVEDFEDIADKIRTRAPDIEVFIAIADQASFRVAKKAAGRPTLVFSPAAPRNFKPRRGKVYCGLSISKVDQMRALDRAGVPVPKWTLLDEDTRLDPAEWGDQVVMKPSGWLAASIGRGVQFVETQSVEYIDPDAFPEDHCARDAEMIVQKFVNTGEFASEYRVLCLFGRPLYAIRRTSGEPQPAPTRGYNLADPRDLVTSRKSKKFGYSNTVAKIELIDDEDVLALASRVYDVFPDAPLQAIDITREEATGDVFVLELNPGGNTWHFSSPYGKKRPLVDGKRREDQFGAFSIAADLLIERARAEAE